MEIRGIRLTEPCLAVDLHPRLTVIEAAPELRSRLGVAVAALLADRDAVVLGTVEHGGVALDVRVPVRPRVVGGSAPDGRDDPASGPLVRRDDLTARTATGPAVAGGADDALLAARVRAVDRLRRAEEHHGRARAGGRHVAPDRRDDVVAASDRVPGPARAPSVSEAELARRLQLRADLEVFLASARAARPGRTADELVERGTVLASRISGICTPDGVREVLAVVDAIATGSPTADADVPRARAALAAALAASHGGGNGHEDGADGAAPPAPDREPVPARVLAAYSEVVSARRALARLDAALGARRDAADPERRLRCRIDELAGPATTGPGVVVLDDPIAAIDPADQTRVLRALLECAAGVQLVYFASAGPVVAWAQDLAPDEGALRSPFVQDVLFPGPAPT